jgi:CRISPR system Cascade subunit CasD
MVSWGDIAVGEVRPSYNRPSKSAILGLVAGALGIRREWDELHRELAESLNLGLFVESPGSTLRDYHTAQVPRGKRARGLPTRRDELEYGKIETTLTDREYLCDAYVVAALWRPEDAGQWDLEELKEALASPTFTPFLGRKSCPSALPFAPTLQRAQTLRAAVEGSPFPDSSILDLLDAGGDIQVYWEGDSDQGFDDLEVWEERRRDDPVSRQRWQFRERPEKLASISPNEIH